MAHKKINEARTRRALRDGWTVEQIAAEYHCEERLVHWHIGKIIERAGPFLAEIAETADADDASSGSSATVASVDDTELALMEGHVQDLTAEQIRLRRRLRGSVDAGKPQDAKAWAVTIGIVQDKLDLAFARLRALRPVEEKHERADFLAFPMPPPPEEDVEDAPN